MTDAVALPVRQQTDEWLEARLDGVTSSDAPVIAGEKGSVVELWAVKSRLIEKPPFDAETRAMFDLGHRLEPVVAEVYTEREGRPLRRVNRMLARKDAPWAYASLDRVSAVKGEKRIVELKTAPWTRWGVGEPVPGDVQAQVMHQLWVTGYDVVDVAVLHRGYDLQIHTIERDDTFIDNLVYLEREFRGWVESGMRPPVDGSAATTRALQRLFPEEYGEVIPATPDLAKLADDLYIAIGLTRSAKNSEATIRNALRALIGPSAGVVGDGFRLSYKKNRDTIETNWEAEANAYRRLLEGLGDRFQQPEDIGDIVPDWDAPLTLPQLLEAIHSLHTRTKTGARVLRPWWANRQAEEQESEAA